MLSPEEAAERVCAHPDCDGWIMHSADARQVSGEGSGMWQAQCSICDWTSDTFGSQHCARNAARPHSSSAHCDGRCAAWDES